MTRGVRRRRTIQRQDIKKGIERANGSPIEGDGLLLRTEGGENKALVE